MKKNKFLSIILISFLLILDLGCKSTGPKNTYNSESDINRPLVDEKYSLKQDRQAFDEIRKEIPTEIKKTNDEMAFVMGLMSDIERKPESIRNTFDSVARKKRDLFSKDASKERELFTKTERKERDLLLKALKDERDQFMKEKHKKEERDEFFKNQETKRKEFFAAEKEKREDFESNSREKRKNFEDYMRERTNYFNQELSIFRKKHDEHKKNLEEQKKKNEQNPND